MAQPIFLTPATFRFPRRSTSQRPNRKSEACGTHSSLATRTLFTEHPALGDRAAGGTLTG